MFMIAHCEECGEEYPWARLLLGHTLCLSCGEQEARREALARRKRVMPMHKSNYVYLGSDSSLHKQKAREMANKVMHV